MILADTALDKEQVCRAAKVVVSQVSHNRIRRGNPMASMRIAIIGAAFGALSISATAARADNAATGLWIDHTGRGAVEITDCGDKLCGHVAWVQDAKNADQCGKQIIGNVKSVGTNKWDNGWIYDPDSGSKYDVELTMVGNDKLKVVGYAGSKWLSETYTWKRAPADLQKCATSGDSAAKTTPAAATDKKTDIAKADEAKPETATKSETVELDAAKPEAGKDTGKPDTATTDEPKPTETAKADTDDANSDEPKGRKRDGGKIVARIMEQLGDGDGPVKVKRNGKNCKVTLPYVDMVVSVPCDDN
jgi:uncharacterized protein (DUF2147 family)